MTNLSKKMFIIILTNKIKNLDSKVCTNIYSCIPPHFLPLELIQCYGHWLYHREKNMSEQSGETEMDMGRKICKQ